MKLYDIISNLKFIGIKNYQELDIDSLTCNADEKTNFGIFFCIKGLHHDGHDFADTAINNGACCLVVERFLDINITQILVENVRLAMSQISSIFFGTYRSKMKFVGITGTNGKTTTTFLIKEILSKLGKRVGLIGTEGVYINNLMLPPMLTTPDPIVLHKLIQDMDDNHLDYCVMEVSAHAIALNKIDSIYYDVVALSNITKDHLDFFLTMENYIKCKASLFDCKHAKMGVVNTDAKFTKEIVKKSNIEIATVGALSDFNLISTNFNIKGTDFKFIYKNKTYSVHMNLIGDYNVSNMLLAIACVYNLDFEISEIIKTIKAIKFEVPGRFNMLDTNSNFSVIVDYAHTPDGIKNVLSTIRSLPVKRVITVFGCGGDRDKTKRPEMCEVATSLSDLVVVTSDNPRNENPDMIIDDIVRNQKENKKLIRITERRSAIEYALSIAKEGDVVAVLGKGAENYQEINGVKLPYSDYEVVQTYFKYSQKGEMKA